LPLCIRAEQAAKRPASDNLSARRLAPQGPPPALPLGCAREASPVRTGDPPRACFRRCRRLSHRVEQLGAKQHRDPHWLPREA
jgi:hypothetical protein